MPRPGTQVLRGPLMKITFALAAMPMLLFASTARAGDNAVEAPILQFIAAFNHGDLKAAKAAHVASPSIADEVAPYHWNGPRAFDSWVADLTRSETVEGKTDGQVTMLPVTRELVSGGHAYVTVPSTYTFKQHGKTMHEVSQMTYILARGKAGWKIESWTWTGPEASPVK